VLAAPLDAQLTAKRPSTPGDIELEVGYDLVNNTVDIFNIRGSDATYAGTNVGDYHGAHVRGGIAITPDFWIDGALWQRQIEYRADLLGINTWQLGAQFKLLGETNVRQPSMALRAGAWGNYSGQLKKSSPTSILGQTLSSVQVSQPRDVQLQLDLIGTTQVLDNIELSAYAGAGVSQVSVKTVSASAALMGCDYALSFGLDAVIGVCDSQGAAFSIPNSVYGVDVYNEAQYKARFASGGLSVKWQQQDWQLRGGYQYQRINRNQVDNTIRRRGGVAYASNHIFMGEVMYRILRNTALFVRGQYMSNQFVGEIPLAYNTLTANRFDKHYGILSTGLAFGF
jgi:hypothetical protein